LPTIRLYANGLTMGVAGRNDAPSKRGTVRGWSEGSVRRHTAWLYSIDAGSLTRSGEHGYAVTLTVRECPPTERDWRQIRHAWLQWCRDHGATRVHWVVEWQRRRVPHLHAAVYFPAGSAESGMTAAIAWLGTAGEFDPTVNGQWWDTISGVEGWLKYLSKHAARGVRHYQRQGKPDGWETTGRLWGKNGDWPEEEPVEWAGTMQDFHRFRRLVRSWRIADARAAGDPKRIRLARRALRCPLPRLSAVRGVSDWVPQAVAIELAGVVLSARAPFPGRTA
jgi:hypothetical protein